MMKRPKNDGYREFKKLDMTPYFDVKCVNIGGYYLFSKRPPPPKIFLLGK